MHPRDMELAMLPYRMARVRRRAPGGWMDAWMETAGLCIGIGNAALRPASTAVVRNRSVWRACPARRNR